MYESVLHAREMSLNGASAKEIKTGLISTATFEEEFQKVLLVGQDVLYFSLSKNISGNYNSARLAAEELSNINGHKIRLIDSLNASLAQGILAIYASEMRDKGMSVDEASLYVMEQIQKKIKVRDFINTSYDFCTGSHVGPDTIALFFLGKDRELSQN